MAARTLQFWFEFASTYSYLSICRIEKLTALEILETLGQAGGQVCERAQTTQTKDRLRRQTAEAVSLGIFGAPSFIADGELFWGNDRLEDAIAWGSS